MTTLTLTTDEERMLSRLLKRENSERLARHDDPLTPEEYAGIILRVELERRLETRPCPT